MKSSWTSAVPVARTTSSASWGKNEPLVIMLRTAEVTNTYVNHIVHSLLRELAEGKEIVNLDDLLFCPLLLALLCCLFLLARISLHSTTR